MKTCIDETGLRLYRIRVRLIVRSSRVFAVTRSTLSPYLLHFVAYVQILIAGPHGANLSLYRFRLDV